MSIPRPEYPRPQFVRDRWLCLNGEWEFEIDGGDSGLSRGLLTRPLKDKILVPFCPESELSGIGNTDFMPAVWYKRHVRIPESWSGQRVLLHFQACDYDTTVWVNGQEVTRHRGGFTPFSCELPASINAGDEIEITVRARDDASTPKPRGKQSQRFQNHGCHYTRTTGIWQTVWLEPVPRSYLLRPKLTPEVAQGRFRLDQRIAGNQPGYIVRAIIKDETGPIGQSSIGTSYDMSPSLDLNIPRDRRRLWSPRDPHLYDIEIELLDEAGGIIDRAYSYAGLRSVSVDGKAIRLNGQVVFQRLVLDQGYYPDGIMTAPSDAALAKDIQLAMQAGFNGARLHQKVFEERFLYHADRLGYLCWGEFADWGSRFTSTQNNAQHHAITFAAQWAEALERDYSHPCIIGWCPLNETWEGISDDITPYDDAIQALFLTTKLFDTSRPVLDTSGYSHRVPQSDIYDSHDYEQNPEKFRANQAGLSEGKPFQNGPAGSHWNIPYRGQPYFVSEFGGIHWSPRANAERNSDKSHENSWGYGTSPQTLEEFYIRFNGLCGVLLDNPDMFGYCYTQLTDVFQEENGLYAFDRTEKFDTARLRESQIKPAAIEVKHGRNP